MGRNATIDRKTKETDITVSIDLDGEGKTSIETGIPFFDHMLNAFAKHSRMALVVDAKGDLEVDAHHTVEDVGIVIGQALAEALGDKRGIERFASCAVPMDEALVLCAMDISGRGGLYWKMDIPVGAISTFDTQLGREFFTAFADNAGITLHLQELAGENAHHLLEASFKSFGRCLRAAVAIDPSRADELPTTKGAL